MYKESEVAGTQWQRCVSVTVSNELDTTPAIHFFEESVVHVNGAYSKQNVAGCSKTFSNDGEFPLLDPATNTPTGQTMSHADLYQALYSLYMQTALERDAAG